jgi:membrane fusion protein (multidrug efflux system)
MTPLPPDGASALRSTQAMPQDPPHHAQPEQAGHELGFDLPEPATVSKGRGALIVVGGLVVLAGAFALAYLPKRHESAALAEATKVAGEAELRVEAVTPKIGSSDRALALPGSVQPLEETVLYARASGYIRKWYVDIGDKVKEGATLAEVETPELDQELDQARAQLLQAQAALVQSKANRELSKANLQRYKQLIPASSRRRTSTSARRKRRWTKRR